MPLYEYLCDACGRRFEVIQKFSDGPPDACRLCGKGPVQRLASSPAIQFKGTGWYVTDYAQKGKSDSSASAKTDGTKTDGANADGAKADGPKADTASADTSGSSKTDSATPGPAPAGNAASTPSKE
jgi:putative FmdB family regulatory protein